MLSLTAQALIFIGSAIVLVPLFHRLGFGSVLGYLLAGIIVGPHALKFIADSNSVLHFAELGVVLLLFIIGLEIQPKKLWSMRNSLVALGLMQILITTTIFSLICIYFEFELLVSLVLGFALSLSSTAFALQTLIEKKQLKTEFGFSSFSILLAQDLIAIPALALIPLIAKTNSMSTHESSNLNFIYFILILILLIFTSRFLIRPVFRLIANMRSREMFTAVTLFIVLGVASLMTSIGLSAALGTFIAGVLLADNEYRHELEADLEPFKSLLMGLFFIGVGMSVNLNLIWQKPFEILLLSVGYIAVKSIVLYLVARLQNISHENSKLISLNIGQGGEFAFVIFNLILGLSIVRSEIVDYLTLVITLSMAMSPVALYLHEKFFVKNISQNISGTYDTVIDETPEVIIAGFGRFGQIFGRLLKSQNIPFVAIDHDSNQIELVRKFGNKVYYGDSSRVDLLESAGAKNAKYFILAVDDVETSIQIAKTVREHFPNLKIFARARNRGHTFDLMASDVTRIKRETFDSSLNFVGELFLEMGFTNEKAQNILQRFREHDEAMLKSQFEVRNDDKKYVSIAQQGQEQLIQVLTTDMATKSD